MSFPINPDLGDPPSLPMYRRAEDVPTPDGWSVHCIAALYKQLPPGKRYSAKTCQPTGATPVLDQSRASAIGFHDEAPGVEASNQMPVITFANHSCAMRIMKTPFSVIQNVFPLVGREGICLTTYFYYATNGRQAYEEYKGHHPTWRTSFIPVPPVAEQRRIAQVLGVLDAKIAANSKLQIRLLSSADMLFKRVCSEARVGGVTPAPASDLLAVNPSVPIPRGTVTPFLEMAAIEPWAVRPASLRERPFSSGCKFERGDTLVAKITGCVEHGKGGFADFVDGPAAGSTEFLVLRPSERLTPEAVFLLSRWPAVRAHLIRRMTGSSGRQRVPPDAFESLDLVVPERLEDWENEACFLRQAFSRSRAAWQEQGRLQAIRDVLLPGLVSGRLEVAADYLADSDELVAV